MYFLRLLPVFFTCLAFSFSAHATPITGASLHGATGALDVTLVSGNNYDVVWSLDTTGFDDADAVATGHEWLTEIAFKIDGMSNVTLLDPVGTLYFPSNVNNHGCKTSGSPAGFACVSLSPYISATVDQVISVGFNVDLASPYDINDTVSFRGKYGTDNGWVISETGSGGSMPAPAPEPTMLMLLGLGLLGLGIGRRRRR